MGMQDATKTLAKVNTTSNETLKNIVNEAEQLHHLVQSGQQSGAIYTDEEVKAILGLNDGLYGMWYPYYYPTQYNPAIPLVNTYYPYYNPWTVDYVNSIDAIRPRVAAEAVLDYYRGVDVVAANPIVAKIEDGHTKAVRDAVAMARDEAQKAIAHAGDAKAIINTLK